MKCLFKVCFAIAIFSCNTYPKNEPHKWINKIELNATDTIRVRNYILTNALDSGFLSVWHRDIDKDSIVGILKKKVLDKDGRFDFKDSMRHYDKLDSITYATLGLRKKTRISLFSEDLLADIAYDGSAFSENDYILVPIIKIFTEYSKNYNIVTSVTVNFCIIKQRKLVYYRSAIRTYMLSNSSTHSIDKWLKMTALPDKYWEWIVVDLLQGF